MTTVKELKRILSLLPDDAEFQPVWADGPPDETDPAVVIRGFRVGKDDDGTPRLEVVVDIQYLDEFEDEDEDEDDEDVGDELYEKAIRDHAKWRGKVIRTNTLVGGNGDGAGDFSGWIDLPSPVEVVVADAPLDAADTVGFVDDDGRLLEIYYQLRDAAGPWQGVSGVPDDAVGTAVDGPTYYQDGRVEYPGWWPESSREYSAG